MKYLFFSLFCTASLSAVLSPINAMDISNSQTTEVGYPHNSKTIASRSSKKERNLPQLSDKYGHPENISYSNSIQPKTLFRKGSIVSLSSTIRVNVTTLLPDERILDVINLGTEGLTDYYRNNQWVQALPLDKLKETKKELSSLSKTSMDILKIKHVVEDLIVLKSVSSNNNNTPTIRRSKDTNQESTKQNQDQLVIFQPTQIILPQKEKVLPSEKTQTTRLQKIDSTMLLEFKSLTTLNLMGQNLSNLPENFNSLSKLKILILDSNPLKVTLLTTTVKNEKTGKKMTIHVKKSPLTNLPERIEHLSINNCKLGHLDEEEISSFQTLKRLDMQMNDLTELPKNLWKIQTLEELDFSNNQVKSIPEEIISLSRLQTLRASNNQIQALPLKFRDLHNLKNLNLRFNPLTTDEIPLPNSIQNLDLAYCGKTIGLKITNPSKLAKWGGKVLSIFKPQQGLINFINYFSDLKSLDISNQYDETLTPIMKKVESKVKSRINFSWSDKYTASLSNQ